MPTILQRSRSKQRVTELLSVALVAKEAADAKRVAEAGAKQVEGITKQVEVQSATVDLAAKKAADLEGVAKGLTEEEFQSRGEAFRWTRLLGKAI